MKTQDNLNLDVEYLEVVTCTYNELCKIKTPVNGRLYHTSDTNEFYFDWNNRRHKLSVFSAENNVSSDNIITKTELSRWLKENDYITNLSLTEALIDVIGTPIENIITKKALEEYANNNLLTKDELNMLQQPLDIIEDIRNLQANDSGLYNYYEMLADEINKVRETANEKIGSQELQDALDNYITKSVVESMYLKKNDITGVYIDEEKLLEKLRGYVTTRQLSDYIKKSEGDSTYLKKSEASSNYVKISTADSKYATKTELNNKMSRYDTKSEVDEKLRDYVKKSESGVFVKTDDANRTYLKKTEAQSTYAKKSDLSNYTTNSGLDSKLSGYAKRIDVTNILRDYNTKADINTILGEYTTKEDMGDYLKKSEIESKYAKKGDLNKYVTKADNGETLSVFAKMQWVDEWFMRKGVVNNLLKEYVKNGELDTKLQNYETVESADRRESTLSRNIRNIDSKFSKYPTKTEVNSTLEGYVTKSEASKYATNTSVDNKLAGYDKKSDIDNKLSNYETKAGVDEKLNKYPTKTEVSRDYAKKSDLAGYTKGTDLSGFAKQTWVEEYYEQKTGVDNKLKNYNTKAEVDAKLSNYDTKAEVDAKLKKYPTKTEASQTYAKKTDLTGYVKTSELEPFSKQQWVDEYYMRKTDIEGYLKKSEANNQYLKITDAENTYAKKEDLEGLGQQQGGQSVDLGGYAKSSELEPFAKMQWVDEYYMRKGQMEGIKNAMVLSMEFATKQDMVSHETTINQGFYYLTDSDELYCAIEIPDNKPHKLFVNITRLEINMENSFGLYFGGDENAHTDQW